MSHRAAKAIRKSVRAAGHDPRDAVNTAKAYHVPAFPVGAGPGYIFNPRTLATDCGRAIYRSMKKQSAHA